MAKWLMIIPPVIFAGLAGMFYVGMQRENPQDIPSVFIDRSAPVLPATALGDYPLLVADDLKTG